MLLIKEAIVLIVGCLLAAGFASSLNRIKREALGVKSKEPVAVEQQEAAMTSSPSSIESPIRFSNMHALSLSIRKMKHKNLHDKCNEYEKVLRETVKNTEHESLNRQELFRKAILSLEKRVNKFNPNENPFVQALQDCAKANYQLPELPKAVVSPDNKNTREGLINFDRKDLHELSKVMYESRPMNSNSGRCQRYEKILRKIVKNRLAESLAAPKLFSIAISSLKKRPYVLREPDDKPFVESLETCLTEAEAYARQQSPKSQQQAEVNREGGQHDNEPASGHHNEMVNKISDNERDLVKKLQQELEHEREHSKALLTQLDQHRRAIAELSEKENKRQESDSPTEIARFEMLKDMYEQASKRELAANEKVEELNRLLESSGRADESHQRNDDDLGNTDDDEEDEVYKDPAMVVHDLEIKLKLGEPLESRCMKYYMLYKYPEEVSKSVVETVAKLPIPVGHVKVSGEETGFHNTLMELWSIVNQKGNKFTAVSEKLYECNKLRPPRAASDVFASAGVYGGQQTPNFQHINYHPPTFEEPKSSYAHQGISGSSNKGVAHTQGMLPMSVSAFASVSSGR